jgi:thiamine kinase-like enzyme
VVDAAILARIWPHGVQSVEQLGGGITTRNYKVVAGGEAFVLRFPGRETRLLGIDRTVEYEANRTAAGLGIAPEVVTFVEPEGLLVTRFVAGETGRFTIPEVAAALKRLHDARSIAGAFDVFRVVSDYAEIARGHGVEPPRAYAEASELARRIRRALGERPFVPCHNDLLATNVIHDGERLWIVDWEYAGMGDPGFDLASFAVDNALDEDGDRELLELHGGDPRAHVLLRFMADFREAMWGVVQEGISDVDFDFAAYASVHFERLRATAASERFRTALG